MGVYTEVFFRAEVDAGAWRTFTDAQFGRPVTDPHPFFAMWRSHLIMGRAGSAYFPGARHFTSESEVGNAERTHATYSVSFRADIKNYDSEIEAFFGWVGPHVDRDDRPRVFIGYSLHEDADRPTLWYAVDGGVEQDDTMPTGV